MYANKYIYIYMCAYMCMYTYFYIHVCVCLHIFIYIYVHIHIWMYSYIYTYIYIYIYVYIYIHIYLYIASVQVVKALFALQQVGNARDVMDVAAVRNARLLVPLCVPAQRAAEIYVGVADARSLGGLGARRGDGGTHGAAERGLTVSTRRSSLRARCTACYCRNAPASRGGAPLHRWHWGCRAWRST